MRLRAAALAVLLPLLVACGGRTPQASPVSPTPVPPANSGLVLNGDPASAGGATWTYRGAVDGVGVDLQGILLKPTGTGPFPAVVISHGAGGNANGYSRAIASEMVRWGLACIATNYTHAGGVSGGAPGTLLEPGASQANIVRGRAALDILRLTGYVDLSRVAAHGHSMGAFVTAALVGARPQDFRVASHSAGGVRSGTGELAAPTEDQVRGVAAPYQMHHGDADPVVPLVMDQRLLTLLRGRNVTAELHVYAGADHDDVSRSDAMLARVRAWYIAHGMF